MLVNVIVLLFVAGFWAFTFIFLKIEECTITPITIMFGRAIIAFAARLVIRAELPQPLQSSDVAV